MSDTTELARPPAATGIVLTPDELENLTGRSRKRPALQLKALRTAGFHRAYINAGGRLVLERAHYEAVCRGERGQPGQHSRPTITPPASLLKGAT